MKNRYLKSCTAIVREQQPSEADARWQMQYWNGRYEEAVIEGEAAHGSGSIENALAWREAYRRYLQEMEAAYAIEK